MFITDVKTNNFTIQARKGPAFIQDYIKREQLSETKKYLEQDLIKVITGPRRAGKSVFSLLLLEQTDFAYVNFDDEQLLELDNYDKLIQVLFEVYSDPEYLLFDEIQNLKKWEVFVNKLQRRDFNIVITGSNSKLLSRELGTTLTGRHIPIELLPFSFREFLLSQNSGLDTTDEMTPDKKGELLDQLDSFTH